MNILVTGGAGYIGSHTVRELLRAGHHPVIYDDLSIGHFQSAPNGVPVVISNLHSRALAATLRRYEVDSVIHLASCSIVGESGKNPSAYYYNNVFGTLNLLDTMRLCGVERFVLSSTAAVYGESACLPIREDAPLLPGNVYARTKLMVESMLSDFSSAYGISYISLRCFNAAGANFDGTIGEDHDPETHLIPLVLQTALGQKPAIDIFGTDYPTPDGTCIRDYVHVIDLAKAHVLALEHLKAAGVSRVYNLGSECGFSVREVINAARFVTGAPIPDRESPRRKGDPASLIASSSRIRQELGWKPHFSSLDSILKSAWAWHQSHPYGYREIEPIVQVPVRFA